MTITLGWWLVPLVLSVGWLIVAIVEFETCKGDFACPLLWLITLPIPLVAWIAYLAIF